MSNDHENHISCPELFERVPTLHRLCSGFSLPWTGILLTLGTLGPGWRLWMKLSLIDGCRHRRA